MSDHIREAAFSVACHAGFCGLQAGASVYAVLFEGKWGFGLLFATGSAIQAWFTVREYVRTFGDGFNA